MLGLDILGADDGFLSKFGAASEAGAGKGDKNDKKDDKLEKATVEESKADSGGGGFGFDYITLIKTLSAVRQGVTQSVQSQVAEGEVAKGAAEATQAAITADQNATAATAKAAMSNNLAKTDAKFRDAARRDAAAAGAAVKAQDSAGTASGVDRAQRVAAAQKALESAKARKDGFEKPFYIVAAQKTLAKAQGGLEASKKDSDAAKAAAEDGGLLTRKIVGPVRIWHAIVGGLVSVTGVFLWRRS